MRYIRTNGPSLLAALQPVAATLDACWWYIGGNGFALSREFRARHRQEFERDEQLTEYWNLLLKEFVDNDTPVSRVGKPGFFSQLADSVIFHWTNFFAIEADQFPLATLQLVAADQTGWGAPFANLPPDVILVARDIDAAYQDYGFRDEWMFEQVLGHLRRAGHPADEIIDWPTTYRR